MNKADEVQNSLPIPLQGSVTGCWSKHRGRNALLGTLTFKFLTTIIWVMPMLMKCRYVFVLKSKSGCTRHVGTLRTSTIRLNCIFYSSLACHICTCKLIGIAFCVRQSIGSRTPSCSAWKVCTSKLLCEAKPHKMTAVNFYCTISPLLFEAAKEWIHLLHYSRLKSRLHTGNKKQQKKEKRKTPGRLEKEDKEMAKTKHAVLGLTLSSLATLVQWEHLIGAIVGLVSKSALKAKISAQTKHHILEISISFSF